MSDSFEAMKKRYLKAKFEYNKTTSSLTDDEFDELDRPDEPDQFPFLWLHPLLPK